MSAADIEKRLTAIEQEMARLKDEQHPGNQYHPIHALEKIHGTFENNDTAFQEAMRLGRQWRKAQFPTARQTKAKRR